MTIRPIAFYLPQFHPIPENDEWWGKGFTEWTNVVKARPLFKGHYQPHLPADLGFYDLRLPEVREGQAALAREYGIHAFCYYHYWFNGRRLLERPFDEVLKTGKPDFPFCLCWANENWTRTWDGKDREILVSQAYDSDDDRAHIRWLLRVFDDPRYIRVDDAPLFLVYRLSRLPNPAATAEVWREEARRAGVPNIYLCSVESFDAPKIDPKTWGFDAAVEFQPDGGAISQSIRCVRCDSLWNRFSQSLGIVPQIFTENSVCCYPRLVEKMVKKQKSDYVQFPCITPMWDNSARKSKHALLLRGSTPELYGEWLQAALKRVPEPDGDANLIFINAWNEWAEGNHLEPCQKWGCAYLEATRSVLRNQR
jgi:lipopolysaccharide biosynthesis protein